jgi:predicted metal-dependent peptidase
VPAELSEIALQLAELASFADVTVVECDARVQRVYRFYGRLEAVVGRGGTDLRPPFDRDLLARFRPDGFVYFTDGLGPFPLRDPGVPTLWVLTKPVDFRCPWGARAHVRAA